VEIVDLIDVEDTGKISSVIKDCISKDPGAFEEDPMILDLEGGGGEAGDGDGGEGFAIEGIPSSVEPDLEYTKKFMDTLDYKVSLITREVGLSSGTQLKSIEGAIYGSILAVVLVGIPVLLKLVL
jgi:tetrahydromethanopterin S-methyltransferase subunit A